MTLRRTSMASALATLIGFSLLLAGTGVLALEGPTKGFGLDKATDQESRANGAACHSYSAAEIRTQSDGDKGWRATDGKSLSVLLDTRADALMFVRIAGAFSAMCRIGGDIPVDYWTGTGPRPLGPKAENEDCNSYDPQRAEVKAEAGQFNVIAARYLLLAVDTRTAAEQMLSVAQANHFHCFIGRNNHRSNRMGYIVGYWRH